jgi:sialate O-acetylesterase
MVRPGRPCGRRGAEATLTERRLAMSKNTRTHTRLLLTALAVLCATGAASAADAHLRLPAIFSDNMVLQAGMAVPVWGWAAPETKVTVKVAGQEKTATACKGGKWMVKLDELEAIAKPAKMTVSDGSKTLTINNILVGEVWLGSGQSNMAWTVAGSAEPDKEAAAAKYPRIRMFTVQRRPAGGPEDDVIGSWVVCSPDTVKGFSAVSYYFGRAIHKELGVPVGLIHSSWGGTRIEPWTPPCGFAAVSELKDIAKQVAGAPKAYRANVAKTIEAIETWLPRAKQALADDKPLPHAPAMPTHPLNSSRQPTGLYNGMIHGLIPYAMRGALWYQGESNGSEGESYYHKMRALIGGWRKLWGQGDFAFYYAQLATFKAPNPKPEGGDDWARVLEAQTFALTIPNTGMAVLSDIGSAGNIHPKNKQDVGARLALWALAKDYGKKGVVYSGPMFKSAEVDGSKMVISFDHVGGGLTVGKKEGMAPTVETPGAELKGFAIQGQDGTWHWADAKIVGETVVVGADVVRKPKAVRYGFTTNRAHCNLYNKEGLPAIGFRTDTEWKPKSR